MKLNLGKRVVLFFHWLISLLLVAMTFSGEYMSAIYAKIETVVAPQYIRIAFIAFAVVYAVLSIAVLVMIFKRSATRSERGFITMDSSETGRVRISIGAIEQMVKQAAGTVDGIAEMRINIASQDDAIAININVSVVSGSHVPTVTMNLQRAIRQFVELNCGVAVRSVSINVHTVVNPADSPKRGRKTDPKAMPLGRPGYRMEESANVVEALREEPAEVQAEHAYGEASVIQQATAEVAEEAAQFEEIVPVQEAADVFSEMSDQSGTEEAEEPLSDEGESPIENTDEEKIG